ncbi:cytochrome P450 [Nocardia yamanashiensis]|uniref:cytochrome P450 n=1 Tax=Nocardia yamanashiensis TaxID=209247 RepID=UPI001E3D804E|nr:cytochrome P450 [Nocardia yamanashiensis]UGT39969.1 cytochrome P450 [Nocardia yamanashiensis]
MSTESIAPGCPVRRITTETGDDAWLVTGHANVRKMFCDRRLGRSHPTPETAPRKTESTLFGGPIGNFDTEWEDHERLRTLLNPLFSPSAMRALLPRIESVTADVLAEFAAAGSPADFHEHVASRLPVFVICELLGVPYADREKFQHWSAGIFDKRDAQKSAQAGAEWFVYCMALIQRKRVEPGEDVLSQLCANPELTDDAIATLAMVLLLAGQETTVVELGLGLLKLLEDRGQWQHLAGNPQLVPNAVEELLRVQDSTGFIRYARTDMDVEGQRFTAGDLVLLDVDSANHDPEVFTDPRAVDVTRKQGGHLAFGYGPRYCVGAPLARLELAVAFEQLIAKFPGLRLAVDPSELTMRDDVATKGLVALPLEW